ncbi:MAG: AMP-binding protein, partial [bacterium]|nr:AMP-binding protein [bacterium]
LLVGKDGGVVQEMGVGEIVVNSDYITPGYWKDANNTGEVFTHDDELGRLYWTGDLGNLTAEETIKMIGRKDLQVKIRGFRVEPGEIETALLQYDTVKEVAAAAMTDEKEEAYLCVYYVSDEGLSNRQLREYMREKLPDYMIPRYFIPLESMPLTSSSKIHREALPDPREMGLQELTYDPPGNEIEVKLVAIWQEALAIDRVGISDNFMELGGHSLLIITIIGKIYQ